MPEFCNFRVMWGPETIAVTAGRPAEAEGLPLNHPITLASNFHGSQYSRCDGTDNMRGLEEAVAALEGASMGVSFSSGMAACAAVFFALRPRRVVLPRVCYLGVRELAAEEQRRGALDVRWVDAEDTAAVEDALVQEPRPDLLWLESPSNPLLQVADVARLCARARELGIPACVDATFATPAGPLRPLAAGATVVVHSATK
jgi:cystathionine gamma-synthase